MLSSPVPEEEEAANGEKVRPTRGPKSMMRHSSVKLEAPTST